MKSNNIFYNRRKKPFFILFFILMLFLMSGVVMLIWNAIIPDISGWKPINYWQALGLLILMRILTGRFGSPKNHHRRRPFLIQGFKEKFENANPEEKIAMKEEWKKRCQGGWDKNK